jgi:hypothetical protein
MMPFIISSLFFSSFSSSLSKIRDNRENFTLMLVLITRRNKRRKKSLTRTIKTEMNKKTTLIKEEAKTTAIIKINFHYLLLSLFVFT